MSKYIGFALVVIAMVVNHYYPGQYSQVIIIGLVACTLIAWLKEIMVASSLSKRLDATASELKVLQERYDTLQGHMHKEKDRSSSLYHELTETRKRVNGYREAMGNDALGRPSPGLTSTREALKTPVPPPRASDTLQGYGNNRVRREDRQPDSSNYPTHHHDNSGMGIGEVALVALAVNAFSDDSPSRSAPEPAYSAPEPSYSEPSRDYSDNGSSCSPSDSGDSGGGGGSD